MIMILFFLVRPTGALTARAMEPARHGSLSAELTSAICAPLAQNTVLEASAIPRPTTMTAHAGEPSHYYKNKNISPLSRSCSACGAEHQGLPLSEASGDRASDGDTSDGSCCSSLWLSCPWDKQPQVSIVYGTIKAQCAPMMGDCVSARHAQNDELGVATVHDSSDPMLLTCSELSSGEDVNVKALLAEGRTCSNVLFDICPDNDKVGGVNAANEGQRVCPGPVRVSWTRTSGADLHGL